MFKVKIIVTDLTSDKFVSADITSESIHYMKTYYDIDVFNQIYNQLIEKLTNVQENTNKKES